MTEPTATMRDTPGLVPPRPKVFFFHIPKTAGSTFNKVLETELAPGQTHAEAFLSPATPLLLPNAEELKRLNFVSGHVPFPVFEANGFDRSQYVLAIILREPIAQMVSHINWMVRIRELEGYEGHSEWIRGVSDDVVAADLSHPGELIDLLQRHRMLFQNVQTRTLADRDGVSSVSHALSNLERIDLVGFTERFGEFLDRFHTRMGLPRPAETPNKRENVNPSYKLSRKWIENTPQAFDFVVEYCAQDLYLYQHALRTRGGMACA